jgi:hypothetical protein
MPNMLRLKEYVVRNALAKINYELLCDYDIVLGLTHVLLILEVVQKGTTFLFVILWPPSNSMWGICMTCIPPLLKGMMTLTFRPSITW